MTKKPKVVFGGELAKVLTVEKLKELAKVKPKKPKAAKAAKAVKAWALLDRWGDFYGYSAPYLFQTRDNAKSTIGELIDNGWHVVRVLITLA